MPLQRCLNDNTLGFDTAKGCPTKGCYRNDNGRCVTVTPPLSTKQLTAIADVATEITTAIDITRDCTPTITVNARTQRFFNAKRRFFTEADITAGQVESALTQGIDWISMVHSSKVTL